MEPKGLLTENEASDSSLDCILTSQGRREYLRQHHFAFEMSREQQRAEDEYEALHPIGAIRYIPDANALPNDDRPEPMPQPPPRLISSPPDSAPLPPSPFRRRLQHLIAEHWMHADGPKYGIDFFFPKPSPLPSSAEFVPHNRGRNSGGRRAKLAAAKGPPEGHRASILAVVRPVARAITRLVLPPPPSPRSSLGIGPAAAARQRAAAPPAEAAAAVAACRALLREIAEFREEFAAAAAAAAAAGTDPSPAGGKADPPAQRDEEAPPPAGGGGRARVGRGGGRDWGRGEGDKRGVRRQVEPVSAR